MAGTTRGRAGTRRGSTGDVMENTMLTTTTDDDARPDLDRDGKPGVSGPFVDEAGPETFIVYGTDLHVVRTCTRRDEADALRLLETLEG
jgi:hypothetical protein